MLGMRLEAPRGLRWGVFGLATVLTFVAVASDPADARRRRHVSHRAQASVFDARYAAIVVDGNSGAVIHAANPDALRHPASLTKIMTLYLLFERLESGKIKLDSELKVSDHASDQSPTKLGLREGSTIQVEDAIKGIVTRSANGAAVVIAENLGGDEDDFAELMTSKAKALGMSRTVYKNASGLPDNDQVTTARDQSILARAIQERFPRYYKYFSIRSFSYRGQMIGNHNHLLGSVEGVDGIKTGYTRASGFNLVTSLHRGNRFMIAVVLGGASAGSRDARMRTLISENIDAVSTKRTAPMIAEVAERPEAKPEPKAGGYALASAVSMPVGLPAQRPAAVAARPVAANGGSTDPIRPVMVKTVSVTSGATRTAALVPVEAPAKSEIPPMARAGLLGFLPVRSTTGAIAQPAPAVQPAVAPSAAPAKTTHTGWMIQVGAFTVEGEAKTRLNAVQGKAAKLLATADGFTEPVLKGDTTYYRARFAGLDKDKAEAACKFLKRNDVDCMPVRN